MAQKLAVGISLIFCIVAVLLLIILYYPKDSIEQELDAIVETKKKQDSVRTDERDRTPYGDNQEQQTRSAFAEVAHAMENFGAAVLALGAVICVAVGLACIVIGCFCVA